MQDLWQIGEDNISVQLQVSGQLDIGLANMYIFSNGLPVALHYATDRDSNLSPILLPRQISILISHDSP